MATKKGLGRGLDILIPKDGKLKETKTQKTTDKSTNKKEENESNIQYQKEVKKEKYDLLVDINKIEPNRKYNTEKETALAVKDLKKGAELVLEEAKAYILEKEGIHV